MAFSIPDEPSPTLPMPTTAVPQSPQKIGLARFVPSILWPRDPDLKTPPDIEVPGPSSDSAAKSAITPSEKTSSKAVVAEGQPSTTPSSQSQTISTPASRNVSCPPGDELCGGVCIDSSTSKCCPGAENHCLKSQTCVNKRLANGTTELGCLDDSDNTAISPPSLLNSKSEKATSPPQSSTATGSDDASKDAVGTDGMTEEVTVSSTPAVTVTTGSMSPTTIVRLWQPPKNAGGKLSIPRMFRAILLIRVAVAASTSHGPAAVVSMSPDPQLFNTSIPTPTPAPDPIYCANHLSNCGASICFDSATEYCCPHEQNICKNNELCAAKSLGPLTVWGCAPPGVTDGLDSRIRTATMMSKDESMITKTGTSTMPSTTTVDASLTASSSSATSELTGNGGSKLGVPRVLRNLAILVQNARALANSLSNEIDCCGDICCAAGEVCARSSTGPKCWPEAGRVKARNDILDQADAVTQSIDSLDMADSNTDDFRDEDNDSTDLAKRKGGGGGAGAAGGAAGAGTIGRPGPKPKKGGAARPNPPTVVYALLLLVSFIVTVHPFEVARADSSAPFVGTPQIDPATETSMDASWLLDKRWSCHKPKQNCGTQGCWNPAIHYCCQQPDGDYGLCMAGVGEQCCGDMCCPKDTECRNEGQYLCYPKDSSSAGIAVNSTEDGEVVGDKNGGGGKGGGKVRPGGGSGSAADKLLVMVGTVVALVIMSLSLQFLL